MCVGMNEGSYSSTSSTDFMLFFTPISKITGCKDSACLRGTLVVKLKRKKKKEKKKSHHTS